MDIGIEQILSRKKFSFSKPTKLFLILLTMSLVVFLLIIWSVQFKYRDKIIELEEVSSPNIALVFGAGLKAKGQPSAVLEDRILTAIQLYQDGRVGKIIMSGDNSNLNHNEVQAMHNFAVEQGVPEDDIILDHAGRRTYDSCFRLPEIFSLHKIVLVTQRYHLPRALYVCNELGINAVGVPAEDRGYEKQAKYNLRESVASVQAWLDVNIFKPTPILGEKSEVEPIIESNN